MLPPPQIHLETPAACAAEVTEESFRAALVAHGVSPGPAGAAAPVLRLRIEGTAAALVGTVRLERAAGDVLERQLQGTSCAEVEDALALVAALALEDEPEPPPPAPAVDEEGPPDLPPPPPPPVRHALAAGVQGAVVAVDAPSVRPALAAFVELAGDLGGGRRELRATFEYTGASVAMASTTATLGLAWWTGRLDACPFVLTLGAFVDI